MFGITMTQVYSVIDKKINAVGKQFSGRFEGINKRQANLKGKVSCLENRLRKMEEFLKIEMVEGEQPKFKKITKTKK